VLGDFSELVSKHAWPPLLRDIDVVINAAGIFSESEGQCFEIVHTHAPSALFVASIDAGVSQIIQVSALGADTLAASRFHQSKKAADDLLRQLPVRHAIVQPSLVFSEEGKSTQLFADLAQLPYFPMPRRGRERVQPVHLDDVADAIVNLANSSTGSTSIALVGSEALTIAQYLNAFRAAFGYPQTSVVRVPSSVIRLGSRMMGMPLSDDSLSMLARDNVASAQPIEDILGRPPRKVSDFFTPNAVALLRQHVDDRFWLPAMRCSVALVWIITALVSVAGYPVEQSLALLARVGLSGDLAVASLYGAAAIDVGMGIATLMMKKRRRLWQLQAALILGYSVIISLWLPEFWLHPYGPVLKNIPLLIMIGFLYRQEKA
jgi:uncharacterized protein YbjT (DUF2867 family)